MNVSIAFLKRIVSFSSNVNFVYVFLLPTFKNLPGLSLFPFFFSPKIFIRYTEEGIQVCTKSNYKNF